MQIFNLSRGVTSCAALALPLILLAIDGLPVIDEYPELTGQRTRAMEQSIGGMTAFHQAPILKSKGETRTLVEENFDKLTSGSDSQPWLDVMYGGSSDSEAYNLPDGLLATDGWQGNMLYEAGGAIALYTESYMGPVLLTPEADYSGEMTVTFRAKAVNGTCRFDLAFLVPNPTYGGMAYAETDQGSALVEVPDDGQWHDMTYTVANYSSDQGGRFQITSYGSGVIDDLKIVSVENFVGAPVLSRVYGFTQDSFSVDWLKVDVASDYKLSLYKAEVDENAPNHYENDFEFDELSDIPSEWSLDCGDDALVAGGEEDSKGLRLYNGQSVGSPVNNALYTGYKFWMRLVYDGTRENVADARVLIETKTYGSDWAECGLRYKVTGVIDAGKTYDLFPELAKYGLDSNVYGVRLVLTGLPDGAYVVFDNLEATTQTPVSYVEVADAGAVTDKCTHTFDNLDPYGNYYFAIQAHDDGMYSPETTGHAFGIAVPDGLDVADVDSRGSYTARWNAVPKATRYIVKSYGLTEIKQAESQYYLVEDYFDKIDESVTSVTDPAYPVSVDNSYMDTTLDEYTSAPGWQGRGNAIVQGMLGVQNNPYDFNYVKTPPIDGSMTDEVKVEFKAYGVVGDPLSVSLYGENRFQHFDFVQIPGQIEGLGVVEGEVTFQSVGADTSIGFGTQYGAQMLLDYVVVSCGLNEGDWVPTLLESVEIESPNTEYGFADLPAGEYERFGFGVNSVWDFEGQTVVSERSSIKAFDLTAAIIALGCDDVIPVETARYSVDGRRLDREVKGVNIVRYSDGSTRKVIVK